MPPLCSIVGSTLPLLALLLVLQPLLLLLLQLLLLLRSSRAGDCMPLEVEGLKAKVEVEVELQVVELAAS
jgi:hypothetical protein